MTTATTATTAGPLLGPADSKGRRMLNKVPEITIFFWIIKVLCTTVGETFSDYLSDTVGLGLTKVTYIMGTALLISLVVQFRARRYVPGIYWLAVVLISVVGTNITDNMVENWGIALTTSTTVFAILLALSFLAWYVSERTLSIHSIFTTRRETFYWVVILFTFALGTATGDLVAEKFSLGYFPSILLWGGLIALIAGVHYAMRSRYAHDHKRLSSNAVLAFWLAYILTRPLGASIGDWMSSPNNSDGGWALGLGTTVTSLIFLTAILVTVVYLSITRRDVTPQAVIEQELAEAPPMHHHDVLLPDAEDHPAPLLHPHNYPPRPDGQD